MADAEVHVLHRDLRLDDPVRAAQARDANDIRPLRRLVVEAAICLRLHRGVCLNLLCRISGVPKAELADDELERGGRHDEVEDKRDDQEARCHDEHVGNVRPDYAPLQRRPHLSRSSAVERVHVPQRLTRSIE